MTTRPQTHPAAEGFASSDLEGAAVSTRSGSGQDGPCGVSTADPTGVALRLRRAATRIGAVNAAEAVRFAARPRRAGRHAGKYETEPEAQLDLQRLAAAGRLTATSRSSAPRRAAALHRAHDGARCARRGRADSAGRRGYGTVASVATHARQFAESHSNRLRKTQVRLCRLSHALRPRRRRRERCRPTSVDVSQESTPRKGHAQPRISILSALRNCPGRSALWSVGESLQQLVAKMAA